MLTLSILAVITVSVVFTVLLYNRLVRGRLMVQEAWSGIDVQLRRRASLLPNLMETVAAYAQHERETFEDVTRARSALQQAGGAAAAARANHLLGQALGHLFAVAESYPQLRASENFRSLQGELSDVEEKIAYARQFYNRNVLDYNSRLRAFPGVLVAGTFAFEPAEFFEADETGRGEVPLNFARTQMPPEPPSA